MSDERPELTVVIPAFDEEDTILRVHRARARAPVLGADHRRRRLLARPHGRARRRTSRASSSAATTVNQGKGAALRTGFALARGRVVVVQDADLEYDPADIPALIAPDPRRPRRRRVRLAPDRRHARSACTCSGTRSATRRSACVTNVLYNTTLTDMETGYKAFTLEVLRAIEPLRESDFRIEPELTAKICRGGFRVYEVPIAYYGRSYAEGKKITWRDGFPALFALVKYRFKD